jgi:hypothetical protein
MKASSSTQVPVVAKPLLNFTRREGAVAGVQVHRLRLSTIRLDLCLAVVGPLLHPAEAQGVAREACRRSAIRRYCAPWQRRCQVGSAVLVQNLITLDQSLRLRVFEDVR